MDLASFLLGSPVNQWTFGIMGLLVLETVGIAIWNERLRRRTIAAQDYLRSYSSRPETDPENPLRVFAQIQRFLEEDVARSRGLLGTLEEVGPILGLMCTFAAFVIALPGFWENLETDPNLFFAKIGMAMGTSFIGLTIKLLAFIQGRRVDTETAALEHLLRRSPSTRLLGREK